MTALELLKKMKEVYNSDSATRCIYGAEFISDGMLDGEFKMIRLAERLIDKEIEAMASDKVELSSLYGMQTVGGSDSE